MSFNYKNKSTIEDIRNKFNNLVDNYSDINKGQLSAIDSPKIMDLITRCAFKVNPHATSVLDIGCGAGNYTVKLLEYIPTLDCTLIDISENMLLKAKKRIAKITSGKINIINDDMRKIDFPESTFDIIMAATTIHHLREDEEWIDFFNKIYQILKPGGSFWITDLIAHDNKLVNEVLWDEYGKYLLDVGGVEFKDWAYNEIEKEDTPRSLNFQINLMKDIGFKDIEILHKNAVFAAFGGIKSIDTT